MNLLPVLAAITSNAATNVVTEIRTVALVGVVVFGLAAYMSNRNHPVALLSSLAMLVVMLGAVFVPGAFVGIAETVFGWIPTGSQTI